MWSTSMFFFSQTILQESISGREIHHQQIDNPSVLFPPGVYFLCCCPINGFAAMDQVYIPATARSLPPHFSLQRPTRAHRLTPVWSIPLKAPHAHADVHTQTHAWNVFECGLHFTSLTQANVHICIHTKIKVQRCAHMHTLEWVISPRVRD